MNRSAPFIILDEAQPFLTKTRAPGRSQNLAKAFGRQVGKSELVAGALPQMLKNDKPITDMVRNAPSREAMLHAARAAGKSEAEINAFAASQPMTPIAIKGVRVFVQDCFGRTFGIDHVPEAERDALIAGGLPYTPYTNRQAQRADVRAEQRAKKRAKSKRG